MANSDDTQMQQARRARLVAIVMIVTMVGWLAAQWLLAVLQMPVRYLFLFDLAALAGFAWALVNVYWIWRARRSNKG
ncbi:DUF5337 domain-containing protein [Brevirhabdus sp.]|uniref:DUF5337 domain-containing protein n=1 Tax=Brevirhabdus sp. TaxID=2004514 RepID=UPI004058E9E5